MSRGSGRAFSALAVAILRGFLRDRTSVFFSVVFPLMFLVLFGGVLTFDSSPRIDLVQVGQSYGSVGPHPAAVDQAPGQGRQGGLLSAGAGADDDVGGGPRRW